MGFCDDDTKELMDFILGVVFAGVLVLGNFGWTVWLLTGARNVVKAARTRFGALVAMDKDKPISNQTVDGKEVMSVTDLSEDGWNEGGYHPVFTVGKNVEVEEPVLRELLQLYHDVYGITPAQMQILRESGDDSEYRNQYAMDRNTRVALFGTSLQWYKDNEAQLKSGSRPKKNFSDEFTARLLKDK